MRTDSGIFFITALGLLNQVVAAPAPAPIPAPSPAVQDRAAKVTVSLSPSSTVVGSSSGTVEEFHGIPYALPPVGPLRLKPPVRRTAALNTFDATQTEAACPQFFLSTEGNDLITDVLGDVVDLPLFQTVTNQKEDCLTINVIRPAGTKAGDNLPVLFWIFGGGFELGWTSMYDGGNFVSSAVSVGKPFVFVAVNYRVGGFGFLPGKEVLKDGSANLGLLDQRMGLEWNADNIAAFGGDPSKVTIWGESAGAISVFDQMALYGGNITYKGKPLFRGGIMDSGSVVPTKPVDTPRAQVVYDTVVKAAGCSAANDTLGCLRTVDYETFHDATNAVPGILSYNSVALSYVPRADGTVLPDSPDVLGKQGRYAAVPMIIGDQEDEGTLFALFQANTTTTNDLINYIHNIVFPDAPIANIAALVNTYDESPIAGSPFRTGILNEVYPQFKRLAAILGDLVFTLTRRAFLTYANQNHPNIPSWSYLASYDYGTPILGSVHGGDILQVFYGILPNYASRSINSYYANFIYNLDPNNATGGTTAGASAVATNWPRWSEGNKLVQFFPQSSALLADDFRNASYAYITANAQIFHF